MTTVNQKTIGTLTAMGKALAETFVKADNQASDTKKAALLKIASNHFEKAKYEIVLTSYATTLTASGMSEATVKTRKSEALQVIKAVDKSEVSEANYNKLVEFKGHYNDFINLAREMVNADKTKPTTKREVKIVKLTDKQATTASELIHNANTSQLEGLISEAVSQVNAKNSPQMAGLKQLTLISNIANNGMNNDAIEQPIKDALQAILAISEAQILAIQTAMQATEDAMNQVTQLEEAPL